MAPATRFSVVIPTFERKEVVLTSVRALSRQTFSGRFEVVVVVDGSTDGSAEVLRGLGVPFPLTVVEQPNRGAATARNHGAGLSAGEILLFLDDDMEAHPELLAEHDRSHREGADAVLGHLPLHPDSPPGFLSAGVESWAEERLARLSAPGAPLTLHDLLTGQMSVAREVFQRMGGFDVEFTHAGSFGNEDVDFGYRLLKRGYKVVFNPRAISRQRYVVEPRQYLRQWYEAGRADVGFARKHPEQATTLFALNGSGRWTVRLFWRPIQACGPIARLLSNRLRGLSLWLLDRRVANRVTTRLFRQAVAGTYWRGVHEAGGMPRPRPARVLAFHAVTDSARDSVIGTFAVPPDQFAWQLDRLERAGYHFVSVEEFLRFLSGRGGLPRRPVLLTFDDCYEDLLGTAAPLLERRRIPAAAFAVSGLVGATNEWDRAMGAPELRLLDGEGLRALAGMNVEIGAHSRSHRELPSLAEEAIRDEIEGSIQELEDQGLRRPRIFAYPYGESDARVERAVRAAGLQAAFTCRPGLVRAGQDPYRIPRIEILRRDAGWRFLFKVRTAGRLSLVQQLARRLPRRRRSVRS
ncbi:MAG: glycosyltransferase [Thermoanaerobaculia bacterium]